MNDIAENLNRIAEEGGGARKEQELVNVDFTLKVARLHRYDYKGEERQSWIAVCELPDGTEDEFYIGGSTSFRQVQWLVDNEKLPLRVRMTRDTNKEGQPYVLKPAGSGNMTDNSPVTPKSGPDPLLVAVAQHGESGVLEWLAEREWDQFVVFAPDGSGLILSTETPPVMQAKVRDELRKWTATISA